MPSNLSTLIRHERKREGVLVPLLEDLFQCQVEIESQEDIDFVVSILQSQIERNNSRATTPVFSPSQLSECLRYVYLLSHHKELEIERVTFVRAQANFYFFKGNWTHVQWQFALHKLDQKLPDEVFKLVGVEVPILSKRKDHGGTVDALVLIYGVPYIVDFKGLNVRAFTEITRGYVPLQYAIQLADYGMLFNSLNVNGAKVLNGLLVSENKGGPDQKHLIALQETKIPIKTYLPEVRNRLEELRNHAEEKTIPKPECVSTKTLQFQGCPFRKFCKEEVKRIEVKARRASDRNSNKLSVAKPSRSRDNRSRRNSKRR